MFGDGWGVVFLVALFLAVWLVSAFLLGIVVGLIIRHRDFREDPRNPNERPTNG